MLIIAIPIINIIILIVWAFGGNAQPTKRNFAKAYLIWFAIAIVFSVFFTIAILKIYKDMGLLPSTLL